MTMTYARGVEGRLDVAMNFLYHIGPYGVSGRSVYESTPSTPSLTTPCRWWIQGNRNLPVLPCFSTSSSIDESTLD